MERPSTLAIRLKEVFLDGRWIANTNYKEQLMYVTMEQATTKIGSLNTIAALTYHINYYLAGILNVFNGGALEIRDKHSFDLPPIASETDWDRLRDELLVNSERFIQAVATMTDGQLEQPFVDEKYGTYARNIEGVIEHSYYHLGQICLIRKMVV